VWYISGLEIRVPQSPLNTNAAGPAWGSAANPTKTSCFARAAARPIVPQGIGDVFGLRAGRGVSRRAKKQIHEIFMKQLEPLRRGGVVADLAALT